MAKADRAAKKGLISRFFGLLNPIRDPSLVVAIILTVIEAGGHATQWWMWLVFGVLNWLAVKALIWLLVNFFFSFIYLIRKGFWVARHPRLAWRLLDALGTEEIIIGGLRPDMFATEDGGLHEGQMGFAGSVGQPYYGGAGALGPGGGYGYDQAYDERELYPDEGRYGAYDRAPVMSQRLSEQTEELQDLIASYSKLLSDWMSFTEEKWRAVSDSQLGWKPLRGRWNGWEEIFSDAWAISPEAAQVASDTVGRRFENSQAKGSAASAVACFLHDMDSLRQSLTQIEGGELPNSPRMGGVNANSVSQRTGKAPIIRNPMIVDADG